MRWLTLFVLLVVTVGYLFIGAAVFRSFESDNEQDQKTFSRENFNRFLENKTCVRPEELEALIRGVLDAYDRGVIATNQTQSRDNWDLLNSLFFSATVVTTIGYGHVSPSTRGGQIFFIFYAIVGIPLIATFLAGIGLKCYTPIKKFKHDSNSLPVRISKTAIIFLLGFGLLVFLPAYGMHRVEGWSMREAIYFSVVTLTTVGFGDFVPGQHEDSEGYRILYRVLVIVWIFIGLAWAAVLLSDIGDTMSEKTTKIDKKIAKKAKEEKSDTTMTDTNQSSGDQPEHEFTAF